MIDQVYSSLKTLESKEQSTDIKLSSFIRDNYQRHYLFHIERHPSNLIGFEVSKQILSLLDISTITEPASEELLIAHQTPIYPSVAHHLGLTFFNPDFQYKVNFSSQKLNFNKYIKKSYNKLRKGDWNF
ncbi:WcbI family polysaccharide biosynthesis putative acetyltransferase [Hydrocoleum sp. CS-953]|uniref:WcbI family polysaccharide biosynthesis putative acetyltransferase n=1 Tax=Hydrocoleum sp. CS-953 TaxID=1671698 RepID=UPI00117A2D74